jgi:PTH1 family peptidyl-tRNA hydrolase
VTGKVLFGLGNPGKGYRDTRHNAGWQVLDHLAAPAGAEFRRTRLLHGEVADLVSGDLRLRLVKPASFMNLVGPVYRRTLEVFEVDVGDALVVVDDFMLEFGRLRLKPEGSPGGHNGLKSVEQAMGGPLYPRLRLGIGPVPPGEDPAVYVLKRYDAAQRRALPDLLARGAEACLGWAREGMETAMNRFNARG